MMPTPVLPIAPSAPSAPSASTAPRAARAAPWVAQCRAPSPWGEATLAATEHGLAGLWFDNDKHHPGVLEAPLQPSHRWLVGGARALALHARGEAHALAALLGSAALPLDPQGTAFQRQVWQALRAIAWGQTVRYGDLARAVGRPQAARAVGAAVGRNPISVLLPCHRVMGADGSLTGYAGGLDRKRALLRHEGVSGWREAGA